MSENYITRLERQVKELREALKIAHEGNRSLIAYVTSEKFWNDSTVQAMDIILRVNENESAIYDAETAI